MYSFLHDLLSDRKGGEIFTLFGFWHFLYILLTLGVIALVLWRQKTAVQKNNAAKFFVDFAFGLYILDFFLMPLAYGEIDIEKLPFHACTAMCVMCFLSYRFPRLAKYRTSLAMLGFLSNVVYLIYPAGVMWHGVHPLSYRVIQTLVFHSAMTVYGFLTLVQEHQRFRIQNWGKDLAVLVCMTLWALLGNWVYNGTSDNYSHFFNWFFVVRDPFGMFPKAIAPFLMPFLNVALFFAVEMILHLIICCTKRVRERIS